MKKWTKEEVSALCASVAELGHSKGIRAFISSPENTQGRTFNGCEYMLQCQRKATPVNNEDDGACSVNAKVDSPEVVNRDDDKVPFLRRFFNWLFK